MILLSVHQPDSTIYSFTDRIDKARIAGTAGAGQQYFYGGKTAIPGRQKAIGEREFLEHRCQVCGELSHVLNVTTGFQAISCSILFFHVGGAEPWNNRK